MLFWFLIGTIAVVIGIALFILATYISYEYDLYAQIGGVIFIFVAIFSFLIPTVNRCEYRCFEKQFEIQKAQYEILVENDELNDNINYIFDMLESNRELAKYQAAKKTYGFASAIPDRVLDIKPIGIKLK